MTAEAADASAAFENPLIPNARLRQIYLAMLKARLLEKALPATRRARTVVGRMPGHTTGHAIGIAGLEACLVSTSVDLGPGDLVSDAVAGGVVDFLRGAALDAVLRPSMSSPGAASKKRLAIAADCGSAARLSAAPGIAERLWAAIGAAAGLRAAAAQAKLEAARLAPTKLEDAKPKPPGVAVVYVRPGEVPQALWTKVLGFAAEQELPVIFVVIPAAQLRRGLTKSGAGRAGHAAALALKCRVPGIAVDMDDAVAIYRVAQESIGRARAGGGPALMECVPFTLSAATSKSKVQPVDATTAMERSLLQRRVVDQAWLDRESRSFAQRLASGATATRNHAR